jgi:hypothetical protein
VSTTTTLVSQAVAMHNPRNEMAAVAHAYHSVVYWKKLDVDRGAALCRRTRKLDVDVLTGEKTSMKGSL